MRYPANWVAGFALLLIVSVVVGSLLVFLFVSRLFRRRRWPAEWTRRNAQLTTRARVDACEAITDVHVRLVIEIDQPADGYRAPEVVRLRGIAHLPAEAVSQLEVNGAIPVRFDPREPTLSTIDIGNLLGAPAERIECESYVERGPMQWKVL